MTGTLFGLGLGPGDPELMTLKALNILKRVPVIAYMAADEGESFARSIATPHLPGGQDEICVRTRMVAGNSPANETYDAYAEEIAAQLQNGNDVAFLCEGDPFFFGSFMYFFMRLAEKFAVEVVPGVTSLTACAAEASFPLSSRNDILTVLPAPLPEDELERRLLHTDAAVIMKVGRHREKVVRVLEKLNLTNNARYVERATLPDAKVCSIGDLERTEGPYFSMILVQKRGEPWK